MKPFKEYIIPFIGLKEGKHEFEFCIDKKFFDAFEYDEFEEVDFKVNLELNKKTTLLELEFVANGTVKVPCDVTGEYFNMNVSGEFPLIVKFGDSYNDENEELLILPHEAYQIEVQQYIYELIVLSVPQKRVNPNEINNDVEELELKESQSKIEEQELDPRWDQLKQLLDKK